MTVTGSISGAVTDPSGQMVPGAAVSIRSLNTGETKSATTNDTGAFSFVAVPPETYTLKVERQGFKTFERTNLVVSANERVAVGDIQLEVGQVSDTVTV